MIPLAIALPSGRVARLVAFAQDGAACCLLATADAEGRVTRFALGAADTASLRAELDALESISKVELAAELRRVRSDLAAKLKIAKSPRAFNTLPRRAEVEAAVQGMLSRAEAAGKAAMIAEVGAPGEYAASFTPVAAARWLAQAAFWITDVLADDLLGEAQRILVKGLKNGTATGELMRELWEAFVPYLGGEVGGKVVSAHRLETIVRTNTTTAYNHGRLTAALDPKLARFVDGVRYSAILDERTTEVCKLLHGKVFLTPAGAKQHGGGDQTAALEALLPPRHFNCRSIIHAKVVGSPIQPEDIITDFEIERAKELSGAGFMQR